MTTNPCVPACNTRNQPEKQGRPVARSAQKETANAKRRPAMSVPKSFGTGGALAARHVPCLAKTTHVLRVISLVATPDKAMEAAEPHILAGCAGYVQAHSGTRLAAPRRRGQAAATAGSDPAARAARTTGPYLMILATTPAPTVRPPSRIAKRRPSSIATGLISSTTILMLSPGMTISTPSGRVTAPVMSVVRK